MTHSEITELLGAYALDAVDTDERTEIEAHLAVCARCRAEVAEHRETATLLAHSGGAAPEGIWQRIADSLDEAPPRLQLVPGERALTSPAWRVPYWARPVVAAVAAAAVVLVVLLGAEVRRQDGRIDELQSALHDPLRPAFQAALEDTSSRVFELGSTDGRLVVRGAVTDDGVGYLRVASLPRLGNDRTYQLWGAAGKQLVSLGVLGAEPNIVSFRADRYVTFAITEEAAPGVVVSDNPPVVAGSVS